MRGLRRLRIGLALLLVTLVVNESWGYVTSKVFSATGAVTDQKWASMPITWRMNSIQAPNITGSRSQSAVMEESFGAWTELSGASIAFAPEADTEDGISNGFDGISLVTSNVTPDQYASGALGLTLVYWFDEAGGNDPFGRPIQFAGQIMEADIMFNPEVAFTTNTTPTQGMIDLQSTATHEIGHLLGLDHTSILSSTMFPTIPDGVNYAKAISSDEIAGISTLYPSAAFATKGKISGVVRTTQSLPVFGAIVTAVNANGMPVASALTDPDGRYLIEGLDAGTYTIYAEPLDLPLQIGNVSVLTRIYPGATVNSSFTTRFR